MVDITASTKVPLTSGKEAEFRLKDGGVEIITPASFKRPIVKLSDLRAAVEELEQANVLAEAGE